MCIGTDRQTKSAFLFTKADVMNYCLKNFALINALYVMCVGFIKCQDSVSV